MEKYSQKGDRPETHDRDGLQDSSKGFGMGEKELSPRKLCGNQRNKRKRQLSTNDSTAHPGSSLEAVVGKVTKLRGATTNDSGQTSRAPSLPGRGRNPFAPPSPNTLERVERVLTNRYKKRRSKASDEEHNSAETPARELRLTHGNETPGLLASSPQSEYQEQRIASNGNNGEVENSNSPAAQHQCTIGRLPRARLPQDSNLEENARSSPSNQPSELVSGEKGDGPGDDSEESSEESEEHPPPNEYREQFRMRYRQLQRENQIGTWKIPVRRARTKRTLTVRGNGYQQIIPTVTAIWRLQYETGCLPGGPVEFSAPKRREVGVFEDVERAGYIGFELMAENLGYTEREMMKLGGYQIEVETADLLQMAWCPPGSEYSRVIATRFPVNAGRWVVDVERGFKYDGSRPFEMPKWTTIGPFQTIEDALVEAKKQLGANQGWEWEQVAMDGAFEIKRDDSTGWVGHWNPPNHEYSHVSVKMLGWPVPLPHIDYRGRIERPRLRSWRAAFWVKRSGITDAEEESNRVEWSGKV